MPATTRVVQIEPGPIPTLTASAPASPCNECAKAIIQSGIKEVIYDSNKYDGTSRVQASMRMFDAAGVNYHQYQRTGRRIEIQL